MLLKLRNQRLIQEGNPETLIEEQVDSGDTTINVLSDESFSGSNKYLLIGEFGDENSEIVSFTSATGNVLTVAAVAKDHPKTTPVYLINANQVQFMRATSATGTYSELNKVSIQPEDLFTVYDDTANTTGYGKARFWNSGSSAAYGDYYEVIRYDENIRMTRGFAKQVAIDRTNARIDGMTLTEDMLDNEIELCDSRIRRERIRWSQETSRLLLDAEIGITEYDLSDYLKNIETKESLLGVWYDGYELEVLDKDDFMVRLGGIQKTTLASAITATTDTTITVTDSSVLASEGTIVIEGDSIDYTSKDDSTNILSGVTNISSTHAITSSGGNDTEVWQNPEDGKPTIATVSDGKLLTFPVLTSSADVKLFTIDYIATYTQISLDSDVLPFPPDLYILWLKAFIGERRGDADYRVHQDMFFNELFRYKALIGSAVRRQMRPIGRFYNTKRR